MNKELRGALWGVLIINFVLFAPSAVIGGADTLDYFLSDFYRIYIWQYSFSILAMPLVLARCYYLNYVLFLLAVVMQIIYCHKYKDWKMKYNYKMPKVEKIIYIIVWVIIIIGVLFSEHTFLGVMSV